MLALERIIVESISKGRNTLEKIESDTLLKYPLILSIVNNLLVKSILSQKDHYYSIARNSLNWKKENSDTELINEIQELSEEIIKNYFNYKDNNSLKLKKIYMSEQEEKIFKSILNNLELFLNGLKKDEDKKNEKNKTVKQKVVLWGHSKYEDIINSSARNTS